MQTANDENPEFFGGSLLHYGQGFVRAFDFSGSLPILPAAAAGSGATTASAALSAISSAAVPAAPAEGGSGRTTRALAGGGTGAATNGVDYSLVEQKRTVARRLFIFLHRRGERESLFFSRVLRFAVLCLLGRGWVGMEGGTVTRYRLPCTAAQDEVPPPPRCPSFLLHGVAADTSWKAGFERRGGGVRSFWLSCRPCSGNSSS